MPTKIDPKKREATVQKFRLQVATAESKVKSLRDQAREAKRRRKDAKRVAQLARKEYKRFKAELAELRDALAKVEAKLLPAAGRVPAPKKAKASPVENLGARPLKESEIVARRPQSAPARRSGGPGGVGKKKPAPPETKALADAATAAAAADPPSSTSETPIPNS